MYPESNKKPCVNQMAPLVHTVLRGPTEDDSPDFLGASA
jgi:hypothetical protein